MKKLFSVTKKDFDIQTFKSGGKGGQHQNKRDSGVRIRHPDSGAVGESREERSQHRNKRIAFKRLTEHYKFRLWLNRKSYEVIHEETIKQRVEKMLSEDNIKIEIKEEGKWVEINSGTIKF
jgi:peptide chain release factor 1